ncbi:tetratricopeptide repeat protein, partial [bacterium]|nr:tetratricopeptide repeat protein [bacterium]
NSRTFWSYNYNVSCNFISISGYSQILLEDGQYDEALILADKLLQKFPKVFEGYEIKIRALLGKGLLNEALNVALERKKMNSEDYEIYLYFFDIYILMQDYDNAQKSLEIAYIKAKEYDLFKNEVINKFLNKKMLLAFVMVNVDEFIENFKIVSNDFKLLQDKGGFSEILNYSDYENRKEICLNYLKKDSEYSKSVLRLLSCLYMQETYKKEAPQVMIELLKEMNNAEEFFKKGDNKSAENIYLYIISKNKYICEAYYKLGILYLQTNRQNKAKDIFNKILEINPNDDQIRQILVNLGN